MRKSIAAFSALFLFFGCLFVSIGWADVALVTNKANGKVELWTGSSYQRALKSAIRQCVRSSDSEDKRHCKEFRFGNRPQSGSSLVVVRGGRPGSYRFTSVGSKGRAHLKLRKGGLKHCRDKKRKNCQVVHSAKLD